MDIYRLFTALLLLYRASRAFANASDPCSSNVYKLPHLNARYKYYSITESYHHDAALFPGWYSTRELRMLDEAPDDLFDCGTKWPLWLNGSHPVEVNEEVNRKVCLLDQSSHCGSEYEIKIKKCPDNNFLYYLMSTPPDAGYCFGVGVAGVTPTFQPLIGEIVTGIETVPLRRIMLTRAYFECKFTESSTEELFYRVAWYQDDNQMLLSDFGKLSSDTVFKLTEEKFVESGMQLGHTLSCNVDAYNVENGAPGPRSDKSAGLFAGIKVLNSSLSFATDEEDESQRTILLQPTVPIGCVGQGNCKIELLATIPEESEIGKCNGISLDLARCGVEIGAQNVVDTQLQLVLQTTETGQYKIDRHARLFLKVSNHKENLIWPNYSLDPISIHIHTGGGRLSEGKLCQANNDPHMYTFDKKRYEIQPSDYAADVYILYKNELLNAEVQIQISRCGSAYCNCGVAVKSGQDIYTINACGGRLIMMYTNCADGYLKVKSSGTSSYQIYFPYGSFVQVYLNYGDKFMNVHVYPSTLDEGNTRGLCGTLDDDSNNDFHDVQGFVIPEESFVELWRVKNDADNMLHANFDMISNIEPYEQGVCICPEYTGVGAVPPLRPISCDTNAVASCSKGKAVSIHDCPDIERRRRSVDAKPKVPPVTISMNEQHSRYERASGSQTWTQDTAETFCRDYMRENPVYEKCEDVPNTYQEVADFDCISDIMLTGVTEWATVSRRTMQSVCGKELTRNMTLRISEYNKPSIAVTIERELCDNECSGVGTCTEGICECPDIYGGSDCSIDLTIPPTMYGLLDDGFCDEREYPCTHAYVFAYPVSDSSVLTCRLQEFYISWNFERISVATYAVAAEFSTLVEAICPIEGLRRRRSALQSNGVFINGYAVSISNDGGVLYSEENDLFIYDSTCVNVDESSGNISFVLLEEFCYIDGQCVFDGTVAPNDNCSVCNTTEAVSSWSTNTNMDINGCFDVSPSSTLNPTMENNTTTVPPVTEVSTTTSIETSATESTDGSVSSQRFTMQSTAAMTTKQNESPEADQNYLWIIGVIVPVALIIAIVAIHIIKKNCRNKTSRTLPKTTNTPSPEARPPTRTSIVTIQDIQCDAEYKLPAINVPPPLCQMKSRHGVDDFL